MEHARTGKSEDEIIAAIMEKYEVAEAVAKTDYSEFVGQLKEQVLLSKPVYLYEISDAMKGGA